LTSMAKEFFRTCNVLPFSCTHLALWRGKVKDPRYMQKKKDSRISLSMARSEREQLCCSFKFM
jgi:hypothetical protein